MGEGRAVAPGAGLDAGTVQCPGHLKRVMACEVEGDQRGAVGRVARSVDADPVDRGLARDNAIGRSTGYAYRHEGIDVLAARSPSLRGDAERAVGGEPELLRLARQRHDATSSLADPISPMAKVAMTAMRPLLPAITAQ
jgi:hypothetical protein